MTFKIGDFVKIKPASELIKITGIGNDGQPVMQKSGLLFLPFMISFGGQSGIVTEIVNPCSSRGGEKSGLKEPAYRVSNPEIFWTADMLERSK